MNRRKPILSESKKPFTRLSKLRKRKPWRK